MQREGAGERRVPYDQHKVEENDYTCHEILNFLHMTSTMLHETALPGLSNLYDINNNAS